MIKIGNKDIPTDHEGYLLHIEDWDENVAKHIAAIESIDLTPAHWEVIYFVRSFYLAYETSPGIRMLLKAMTPKLGAEKANSRYLQRLFPDGAAKLATKLAGLPKPAKCL